MYITGQSIADALSAFAGDAGDFLQDNPLLIVALAVLAVVFFAATRPRVG